VRTVTFKIYDELLERLDEYARLKGVSRSEVIRKAIELYLRETQPITGAGVRVVRV